MSDLISRQAAIDALCRERTPVGYECRADCTEVEILRKLPPVEAEPKTGEWVNTAPSDRSDNIICDQCGYNSIARYDYCPNCGAMMKGGDDE